MKQIKIAILIAFLLASGSLWADVGAPISIKMIALKNGETRHVKYNQYTGEAWWAKNTTWKKIKEKGPISQSNYQFEMISTGKSWRLLRLDKVTGVAWKNSFGKWVKFENE